MKVPLPPTKIAVDWEEMEEAANSEASATYAPKVLVQAVAENKTAGEKGKEKSQLQAQASKSTLVNSSARLKKAAYEPILPANIFTKDPKRKISEQQRKEWDDYMEFCKKEEEEVINSQSYKQQLRAKQQSKKTFKINGLHHAHKPDYNSLLDKNMTEYYSSELVQGFLLKNKVVRRS